MAYFNALSRHSQIKEALKIVACANLVASLCAALYAAMGEDFFSRIQLQGYRAHHALALARSISRININVLTPQAKRTMIGIAAALRIISTVLTGKVLNSLGKSFHLQSLRAWKPVYYRFQVRGVACGPVCSLTFAYTI